MRCSPTLSLSGSLCQTTLFSLSILAPCQTCHFFPRLTAHYRHLLPSQSESLLLFYVQTTRSGYPLFFFSSAITRIYGFFPSQLPCTSHFSFPFFPLPNSGLFAPQIPFIITLYPSLQHSFTNQSQFYWVGLPLSLPSPIMHFLPWDI